MILEIRLSNFFSIAEEVIIDLRAGNINSQKAKMLPTNIFRFDDIDILKTVAIYGANASGKSNIIKAIRFCHAMVYESHKHNEDTLFNFRPHKYRGFQNKPSSYSVRFVINNIEYKYSFTLTNKEIIAEELYYYPNGRKAKIFVRNENSSTNKKDIYSFGTSVIKRPFDVAENTSRKTLYISRASQMDREIPKLIFNYFHSTFILRYLGYSAKHLDQLINNNKTSLLKALQFADSDIVDFKQVLKNEKGKNLKANLDTQEAYFEDTIMESIEIKTYHKYAPSKSFDFVHEESDGTKKLFFIMLTILDIIKNNKVLLIDEIEDSLHPKMLEYIIDLFNLSESAQLIFTTHNTHILDLSRFRKDQIWFVNKKENGCSDLYSLYDYSDFRDTMDVEKAYLQGRFDSIPIVVRAKENLKELLDK